MASKDEVSEDTMTIIRVEKYKRTVKKGRWERRDL